MHSTWCVIGNASKARSPASRYPRLATAWHVARQRRRVAGDVRDRARGQRGDRGHHLAAGAGARRVEHDEVGRLDRAEPAARRARPGRSHLGVCRRVARAVLGRDRSSASTAITAPPGPTAAASGTANRPTPAYRSRTRSPGRGARSLEHPLRRRWPAHRGAPARSPGH